MGDALTLARPYARAAFAVAQTTQQKEKWSAALIQAAKLGAHPKIVALMSNSVLSQAQQLTLFAEKDWPDFRRFIEELIRARRLNILAEISQHYQQLWAEAEGVVHATLTTAQPVSAEQQHRLIQALEKRFQCQIELTTVIDSSLVGGAVIEANGVIMDGSIHGKLTRLKDQFAFSSF